MKRGLDCWVSPETKESMKLTGHRIFCYAALETFNIGTFRIFPFKLQHDVKNHGFIIKSVNGEKLVYITDTYYTEWVFADVDYYLVECSYYASILDENLKADTVTHDYAKRLKESHFELENVKEFFRKTDTEKTKQIYLLHLSEKNSDEKLFKEEIIKITGKPVEVCI